MDTFYKNIITDKTISYFFTEVIKLNWEMHIPLMVDFWETVLFGGYKYKGNPMLIHMKLHKKEALHPKHFERWIHIWETTVKSNFNGVVATKAK